MQSVKHMSHQIVNYDEIIKIIKTGRKTTWARFLACSSDCSETHYVAQSGLEHVGPPPTSVSEVLGDTCEPPYPPCDRKY